MPEDSQATPSGDALVQALGTAFNELITMVDCLENEPDPLLVVQDLVNLVIILKCIDDLTNKRPQKIDIGLLPLAGALKLQRLVKSAPWPQGDLSWGYLVDELSNILHLSESFTPELMQFANALPNRREELMNIRRLLGTARPDETPSKPALADPAPDARPFFRLGELGEKPFANHQEKKRPTRARCKVLKVLFEAGPEGLSQEELREISDHPTADRMLKALAKDPDWKEVILFGGRWGGYCLDPRCFV